MLIALDNAVFYLINHTLNNKFFDVLMPWVTRLGDEKILFAIAVGVFLFRKKEAKLAAIYLAVGLAASYEVLYFLKSWVARPRPFGTLSDVYVLVSSGKYSFPSGHATDIFLAATLFCFFFKKPFYFYLIASLVAFSRVYCGVHYPSDVIAGALIGFLLARILLKAGGLLAACFKTRENKL